MKRFTLQIATPGEWTEECYACEGHGKVIVDTTITPVQCYRCKGKGHVRGSRKWEP